MASGFRMFGDPFRPRRRPTRVVHVGAVPIGGDHPIVVQSMTNTDTMDTDATVEQITRLAEAGCEIVRVTAPSIRDAENLREIRRRLVARRVTVPLVADIHFTPNAALIAAEVVEKVRINPGNYADKKRFEIREYDDAQYAAEIERVAERFRPLVRRCKANGVAMRIGTNHGSLSDRILNRFGDTPEGMVESALEFLDVCEDEGYLDVVFSMKASNTQVAIQAYRLLAARLEARRPGEPSYPFHVGVTEAGDSEDGRIKSAIGIGSLLADGLGDTIRVSLTEDPVREVPVARALVAWAEASLRARADEAPPLEVESTHVADPFRPARRATSLQDWGGLSLGDEAPVRVELDRVGALDDPLASAARLAMELATLREIQCESLLVTGRGARALERLGALQAELASLGLELPISLRVAPDDDELLDAAAAEPTAGIARWVGTIDPATPSQALARWADAARKGHAAIEWEIEARDFEIPALVRRGLAASGPGAGDCMMSLGAEAPLHAWRVLVAALGDAGAARTPIVLRQALPMHEIASIPAGLGGLEGLSESELLRASVQLGSLLCDGVGDVVSIRADGRAAAAVDLAYRVLQGARQRTTRTEYISCPSCGRTLFDLEETTARIKERTRHLKNVKIAIMGCIVNGPGEMADADFGYVGSGVGQVTLYVGKEIVARAVPEAEAPDRLVELIQEHGRWAEEQAGGATYASPTSPETTDPTPAR
jgi:(E)-4-hydroxy-3-methylbut-2-enyl-diphosphate synthase